MTHNERVLRLLSDGKPHTHHEIYGLYVVGHSRIADLRKRGHVIKQWREGDDYLYQLTSSAGVADGARGDNRASRSSSGTAPAEVLSPPVMVASPSTYAEPPAARPPSPGQGAGGQLTLDAA